MSTSAVGVGGDHGGAVVDSTGRTCGFRRLRGDSAVDGELDEAALELTFFFAFDSGALVLDGLPLHSVSDLDMSGDLVLRSKIGFRTKRKTPAIIKTPFWVIRMK